ncbi:MAG: hypothetical protein RLN92_10285 [Alloalcanivorax xenomutans]
MNKVGDNVAVFSLVVWGVMASLIGEGFLIKVSPGLPRFMAGYMVGMIMGLAVCLVFECMRGNGRMLLGGARAGLPKVVAYFPLAILFTLALCFFVLDLVSAGAWEISLGTFIGGLASDRALFPMLKRSVMDS